MFIQAKWIYTSKGYVRDQPNLCMILWKSSLELESLNDCFLSSLFIKWNLVFMLVNKIWCIKMRF